MNKLKQKAIRLHTKVKRQINSLATVLSAQEITQLYLKNDFTLKQNLKRLESVL